VRAAVINSEDRYSGNVLEFWKPTIFWSRAHFKQFKNLWFVEPDGKDYRRDIRIQSSRSSRGRRRQKSSSGSHGGL